MNVDGSLLSSASHKVRNYRKLLTQFAAAPAAPPKSDDVVAKEAQANSDARAQALTNQKLAKDEFDRYDWAESEHSPAATPIEGKKGIIGRTLDRLGSGEEEEEEEAPPSEMEKKYDAAKKKAGEAKEKFDEEVAGNLGAAKNAAEKHYGKAKEMLGKLKGQLHSQWCNFWQMLNVASGTASESDAIPGAEGTDNTQEDQAEEEDKNDDIQDDTKPSDKKEAVEAEAKEEKEDDAEKFLWEEAWKGFVEEETASTVYNLGKHFQEEWGGPSKGLAVYGAVVAGRGIKNILKAHRHTRGAVLGPFDVSGGWFVKEEKNGTV